MTKPLKKTKLFIACCFKLARFTNFHFWENYIKQSHKESTFFFIWSNWPRNVAFIPLCQRCHDEDSAVTTHYRHMATFYTKKSTFKYSETKNLINWSRPSKYSVGRLRFYGSKVETATTVPVTDSQSRLSNETLDKSTPKKEFLIRSHFLEPTWNFWFLCLDLFILTQFTVHFFSSCTNHINTSHFYTWKV